MKQVLWILAGSLFLSASWANNVADHDRAKSDDHDQATNSAISISVESNAADMLVLMLENANWMLALEHSRTSQDQQHSRVSEVMIGRKLLNSHATTVSLLAGLRDYHFSDEGAETLLDSRWREVFAGAQVDYRWSQRNTLTAKYQADLGGDAAVASLENGYGWDSGLSLGLGYEWQHYKVQGQQSTNTPIQRQHGHFMAVSYSF